MKRNLLLLSLFFLMVLNVTAQDKKYWITFRDKDVASYDYRTFLSSQCIENRTLFNLDLYQYSDVPVTVQYIQGVKATGVEPMCRSRWLNAISAYMTAEQLQIVSTLPYVASIDEIDRNIIITSTTIDTDPEYLHKAMSQMGLMNFKEEGLDGTGVVIGVIDAGYYDANTDKYLLHIFDENKILYQRDFIDPSRTDLVTQQATDSDYHGRMVLDMIAGYDPAEKVQYGMAPNAKFVLARTENGASESRREEDHWIMAMEWMDSLGVRLISTSLGYAINMDNPAENYKQSEMDGKTARITKAAQIAYDEKGIFLVVSAGNEGDNSEWRIIGAPADAKGVLSVGATNRDDLLKIGYSSIGPEDLGYLKPNVSCFSPNGTSFSCPAVCGFVACLMQKAPNKSNKEIKDIMERCGHLYPFGNNYLGYGVPQSNFALKMLEEIGWENDNAIQKTVSGTKFSIQLDKTLNVPVEVFHKKNKTIVVSQQMVAIKKGKLKITRPNGVARTTFTVGTQVVVEIIWSDTK